MKIALTEIKLIDAVVAGLKTASSGLLTDDNCGVLAVTDMFPTITGHEYAGVLSGGPTPGPVHDPSGGVYDLLFSAQVTVVIRALDYPRDRMQKHLRPTDRLATLVDLVFSTVDFSYDIMNAANTLLTTEGETDLFIKPLVLTGIDKAPRVVEGSAFGDTRKDPIVGLARTLTFGGARRITRRT